MKGLFNPGAAMRSVALVCGVVLGMAGNAQAADYTFKYAHMLPPTHLLPTKIFPAWAEEVKRRSDGRIEIEFFPAQQLLKTSETYDGVRSGVADIGLILPFATPGRFARLSIMELPFMFESSESASYALNELYKTGALNEELADVQVLYLHTVDLGGVFTRSTPVRKQEDVKGLRIRFPSNSVKALLDDIGAIPVGIPVPQIYENLERGVVDGAGTNWGSMESLSLADFLNYSLDLPMYTLPICVCMNRRVFDGLPEDLRQVLLSASADLSVATGRVYDEDSAAIRSLILSRGKHQTYTPTKEEAEVWRASASAITSAALGALEKEGIAARKIYDELVQTAAKYHGQHGAAAK